MGEGAAIGSGELVPDHVPAHLVKQFDFRYCEDVARDPWTYYSEACKGEPVFWTPCNGGHWVVSGAQVVDEVFRRYELFSNGVVTIPAPPRPQSIPSSLDPPEHGKYRKILSQQVFSPRALAPIAAYMDQVFGALQADLAPRGNCEFIADFARPLPVALVLRIMGLPADRQDHFREWSRKMFHGDSIEEHLEGHREARGFLGDWVAEQREAMASGHHKPGDSSLFIEALTQGRVDGRLLTHDEIHSISMLMLGAGVDTLTSQMGHAMLHFATHPQDRERLVAEPELAVHAVEELLRRYAIANITRVVAKDQQFHGVTMKKGDLVLCSTVMGGLDQETYGNSLLVDFDRLQPFRHTPFGAGPHICPGAWLARTVLRAMLERLLPAMPGLCLAEDAEYSYVSGLTIGLTRLPLGWDTK
ncbi:MAG: cytochrome P450 [Novosphingobium sp.]|nr:cytochrome P450 [Novosphingobium sp.]